MNAERALQMLVSLHAQRLGVNQVNMHIERRNGECSGTR